MNQIHNLDEDASEYFEFILKGNTYRMRYPTTEEIEKAGELKTDQEKTQWMYSFITSDGPPIEEALKKTNIKAVRKFNEMVTTEFGA